jgi:pyridoxal phosphate enzyme (YggS family)
MALRVSRYQELLQRTKARAAVLVAVTKVRTVEEIRELYELGHRDFGENYVQELLAKKEVLPGDIRWHFIGHLQTNKVKYLAPFIYLIQGVDSLKLLKEIQRQGERWNRVLHVLLQVHISGEETKFGMNEEELRESLSHSFSHVRIRGLMGMASNTSDEERIREEFRQLARLYRIFFPWE